MHRESFLYFFLNNEEDCGIVSLKLIYTISTHGAKVSTENTIHLKGDECYSIAKNKVLEIVAFGYETSIPFMSRILRSRKRGSH